MLANYRTTVAVIWGRYCRTRGAEQYRRRGRIFGSVRVQIGAGKRGELKLSCGVECEIPRHSHWLDHSTRSRRATMAKHGTFAPCAAVHARKPAESNWPSLVILQTAAAALLISATMCTRPAVEPAAGEGVGHRGDGDVVPTAVAQLAPRLIARDAAAFRRGAAFGYPGAAVGRLKRAAIRLEQPLIGAEIVLRHARDREALFSKRRRTESRERMRRFRTAATARSMLSTTKPVTPSSTTSRTDPRGQAITGVPLAIASIITSPNGSGQSIGKSRARASPRNLPFRAPRSRRRTRPGGRRAAAGFYVEIVGILIDLRRDLQRQRRPCARSRSPGPAASPGRSGRGRRDSRLAFAEA